MVRVQTVRIATKLPDGTLQSFASGGSDPQSGCPSQLAPPMDATLLNFLAPRLVCADGQVSGTRKQIVWILRVCTQQEETEDSIKYNVTWHIILLSIPILTFFAQALRVAWRVDWETCWISELPA